MFFPAVSTSPAYVAPTIAPRAIPAELIPWIQLFTAYGMDTSLLFESGILHDTAIGAQNVTPARPQFANAVRPQHPNAVRPAVSRPARPRPPVHSNGTPDPREVAVQPRQPRPAPVVAVPAVSSASVPPPVVTPAAVATPAAPTAPAPRTTKLSRKVSAHVSSLRMANRIHVSQVFSPFNRKPAAGNRDCGPASVVMALAALGIAVPGTRAGAAPQARIDRARLLARVNRGVSATNHDLERALHRSGTATETLQSLAKIRSAVLNGSPVILNGNPRNAGAYGHRFNKETLEPYNGAHWIVVTGIDSASGRYIINDPLSKTGALKVTARELEAYRDGSLGISVTRA